jgi:hypothetical protein
MNGTVNWNLYSRSLKPQLCTVFRQLVWYFASTYDIGAAP